MHLRKTDALAERVSEARDEAADRMHELEARLKQEEAARAEATRALGDTLQQETQKLQRGLELSEQRAADNSVKLLKQLEELREELSDTRESAARAADLQRDISALQASRDFVAGQRRARPAVVLILEELTQRIPDDTYLTRLEVKGERVSLQGSSLAASALIAILEDSPYLTAVRFASPVVRQGTGSRERFHVAATLARPDAGGADQRGAGS